MFSKLILNFKKHFSLFSKSNTYSSKLNRNYLKYYKIDFKSHLNFNKSVTNFYSIEGLLLSSIIFYERSF